MKPKHKILSVVGARPQFVKLAPLVQPLAKRFDHLVVHTGQHFDDNMSGDFFRLLNLPKIHSNLRVSRGSHGAMIGRMLIRLEKVLGQAKPDLVIVYGDANSTLAGALAAAKQAIPVAHVEAGMRANGPNLPEETNRRLTDQLATLLFCVTGEAGGNLRREKLLGRTIISGDLMLELLYGLRTTISDNKKLIKKFTLQEKKYLLLTVHRPSTTDTPESMKRLVDIVEQLAMPILFPVHPRTNKVLRRYRLLPRLKKTRGLVMTDPLPYLDTMAVARHARAVLTDSGGLQKEALALGTPVPTLRYETEWVDTLGRGNTLVGLEPESVLKCLASLPRVPRTSYRVNGRRPSQIIVSEIVRFLRGR